MKKIINYLLVLSLTIIYNILIVNAKASVSVGYNYGDGADSTNEATIAYNKTKSLGYTAYKITSPTYSNLTSTRTKYNNGKGGTLFFMGHANSQRISWNQGANKDKVSIAIGNDRCVPGYEYVGISGFTTTNLAVFMGCNTAQDSTSNLPKDMKEKYNAKAAIGWSNKIYEGDTDTWAKRFYTKLAEGSTIDKAITYANSGSYAYPSNMQSVKKYGTTSGKLAISNELSVNKIQDTLEIKNKNALDSKEIINKGIDVIKNKFNKYFDDKNYIVEKTITDDGIYYNYTLKVNNLRSNVGYVIFYNTDSKELMVTNNMGTLTDKSAQLQNDVKINKNIQNLNIQDKINEIMTKYSNLNENFDVTLDSYMLIYDFSDNCVYLNIYVNLFDKTFETNFIDLYRVPVK